MNTLTENKELIDLELNEVSLVPRGDDPLAKVAIVKFWDGEGDKENQMEDTIKMSDKMKTRMKYYMEEKGMSEEDARKACSSDMEKAWELSEENERLRKGLIENGFVIKADTIEKKAPIEEIEVEGVMVAKADIPAPVLKALEAAEFAKRDAEITKKAEQTLPHFDVEVAKSLMGLDLDEKVMQALMAADAAFEAAMGEVGKKATAEDMSSPEDRMEELVKAYRKEHGVTSEKAYAEVSKTDEGKVLVKEIYKKD